MSALSHRLRNMASRTCRRQYDIGDYWNAVDDAADEIEEMSCALKVIHTWATFDNGSALIPEHVADLCRKALRRVDALSRPCKKGKE